MLSMKRKILAGMVVLVFVMAVVVPVVADLEDYFYSPSGFGDGDVKVWEKRTDEYIERQYWKINRADEAGMKLLDMATTLIEGTGIFINVETYNMVREGYRKIPTPDDVAEAMKHVEPGAKIIVTKSLEDPQDIKVDYVYAWGATPLFEQKRRGLKYEDILPRASMNSNFYYKQHAMEILEEKEPYCSEYWKLVENEEKWKKEAEHLKSILSDIPISTQTPEPLTEMDEERIKKISDEQNKLIPPPKSLPEEPSETLGGVNFTSIQLNYISTFSDQEFGIFNYALKAKKAEKDDEIIDIEDATELSLNSFFIGLTLPESKFWVNLNPWEPDVIMDEDLRNTDMGRIMLEADLRMKKDFCKYENPCESEIGKDYWKLLDKKSEELAEECMRKHPDEIEDADNILFSSVMRHWIVPDKTDTYGTEDEVYIVNMTLTIESEPVYKYSTYKIVNQNPFVSDECKEDLSEAAKEYGRYAMELEEEMILPLVVQEVNHDRNYSDLRQVYTSLALAQWYKDKYRHTSGIFTDLIDSKDLEGLESKSAWSAEDIWREYKRSFEEGEYHCWKNRTYKEGNYIITESLLYSSGGVDFTAIKLTNIGAMPSNLKDLTSEAVYAPFANEGDDYYFGDGLYVFYPSPTPTTEVPTPKPAGFEEAGAVAGLLAVAFLIKRKKRRKK